MQDFDDVRRKLSGSGFQVVFDINGREAVEAEPLLDALTGRGGSLEQYIYCSSAGAQCTGLLVLSMYLCCACCATYAGYQHCCSQASSLVLAVVVPCALLGWVLW
jgi:hypothetical protein